MREPIRIVCQLQKRIGGGVACHDKDSFKFIDQFFFFSMIQLLNNPGMIKFINRRFGYFG